MSLERLPSDLIMHIAGYQDPIANLRTIGSASSGLRRQIADIALASELSALIEELEEPTSPASGTDLRS